MKSTLFIMMAFVMLVPHSSAFASWHWSSPYEVCGLEVIKKGEKCELEDNKQSANTTENQPSPDSIDNEKEIPDWTRNNAKWWSEGNIDDESFVGGIEFLIKAEIIQIPKTAQSTGGEVSDEIPPWIKNNADWWSQGLISDSDFLKGITFMVENGIITV